MTRECIDCRRAAQPGDATPATHTYPLHGGPRTIAVCDAHAVKARRYYKLTRIEGE